jgi:riboflavin biosynthesis pyrimidine reductase
MQPKFNLLLTNPILTSDEYYPLDSEYLTNCLGMPLTLPKLQTKPFIISCFALSIDGKLAYPDLANGFAIAQHNSYASQAERYGDWWNLGLGRTLCDAVIIGSNSLIWENDFTYSATIDNAELIQLRQSLGKPRHLLHIIVTRDPTKLDFNRELVCQANEIPLLIITPKLPANLPPHFSISYDYNFNLDQSKQIIIVPTLAITQLINRLAELGITSILNESPYFHHELQRHQLLTEAWLNTSGVYIGGQVTSLGQAANAFSANSHPHYEILTTHSLGYNFLYNRYRIIYPCSA